jgi:hypothetical protein
VLDAFACGQRGVYATWQMMSSGKLKVFSSLGDYSQEFSIYARDTEWTVISQRSFDWMPSAICLYERIGRQTKPVNGPRIFSRQTEGNPAV